MNWDSPEDRYALLDLAGAEEYSRQLRVAMAGNVIDVVNGHAIRSVHSRFGLIFTVGDTGVAFQRLPEAVDHAISLPDRTTI